MCQVHVSFGFNLDTIFGLETDQQTDPDPTNPMDLWVTRKCVLTMANLACNATISGADKLPRPISSHICSNFK